MKHLCVYGVKRVYDVKNDIIQMTSENNDLGFDRSSLWSYEVLDEAIQRHAPTKSGMFKTFTNKMLKKSWRGHVS